jgi:hypothetical protein
MAFPIDVMAFPVTGRSQLLGFPTAWRWRHAKAKWRWGPVKWRGPPHRSPQVQRHFIRPKRHLAIAWRRRQAMGTPSNRERHNIRYPKTAGLGGGWETLPPAYCKDDQEHVAKVAGPWQVQQGGYGDFVLHVSFAGPMSVNLGKTGKTRNIVKSIKTVIQVEFGDVWGCPGGAHGPY